MWDEQAGNLLRFGEPPKPEPIKINPSEGAPLWRKPKEKKNGN